MPHDLRNNPPPYFKGNEVIYFRGPKTWALVPDDIKNAKMLTEFKTEIRNWEINGAHVGYAKYMFQISVFYKIGFYRISWLF